MTINFEAVTENNNKGENVRNQTDLFKEKISNYLSQKLQTKELAYSTIFPVKGKNIAIVNVFPYKKNFAGMVLFFNNQSELIAKIIMPEQKTNTSLLNYMVEISDINPNNFKVNIFGENNSDKKVKIYSKIINTKKNPVL